jgi:hypothetical protein
VTADIAVDSIHTNEAARRPHQVGRLLEVEKYPTATFRSTDVRANGENCAPTASSPSRALPARQPDLEFNGVNPGMGHGEVAASRPQSC